MMAMEPFEVYRHYLALKLHFTTDRYDIVKQQGRIKASKQAFLRRSDLFSIKKLAKAYTDKEIVDFLVANFVSGDRWGGVFDTEAKERYLNWKTRQQSLSYLFTGDIKKLNNYITDNKMEFIELFDTEIGQHPPILKLFLSNRINLETVVILNKLGNFTKVLDKKLSDDLIWPDTSRLIKKYSPFIQIDKKKYDAILRSTISDA